MATTAYPNESVTRPAGVRSLIFIYTTLFLDMMGSSLLIPIIPYIIRQYNSDALTVANQCIRVCRGIFPIWHRWRFMGVVSRPPD